MATFPSDLPDQHNLRASPIPRTLREHQSLFASLIPHLITNILASGHHVTLGDAYRDPRVFGPVGTRQGYGHPKSAHKQRLALDLNLFSPDGTFLQSTEAHRPFGEWWELLHPLARWGGRFDDGNHYSIEFQGIR